MSSFKVGLYELYNTKVACQGLAERLAEEHRVLAGLLSEIEENNSGESITSFVNETRMFLETDYTSVEESITELLRALTDKALPEGAQLHQISEDFPVSLESGYQVPPLVSGDGVNSGSVVKLSESDALAINDKLLETMELTEKERISWNDAMAPLQGLQRVRLPSELEDNFESARKEQVKKLENFHAMFSSSSGYYQKAVDFDDSLSECFAAQNSKLQSRLLMSQTPHFSELYIALNGSHLDHVLTKEQKTLYISESLAFYSGLSEEDLEILRDLDSLSALVTDLSPEAKEKLHQFSQRIDAMLTREQQQDLTFYSEFIDYCSMEELIPILEHLKLNEEITPEDFERLNLDPNVHDTLTSMMTQQYQLTRHGSSIAEADMMLRQQQSQERVQLMQFLKSQSVMGSLTMQALENHPKAPLINEKNKIPGGEGKLNLDAVDWDASAFGRMSKEDGEQYRAYWKRVIEEQKIPLDQVPPKVLEAINENPDAIYGYSPKVGTTYEVFDFTDPKKVQPNRKVREGYLAEIADQKKTIEQMKKDGVPLEEIAKYRVERRNVEKETYRAIMGDEDVKVLEQRNQALYQDDVGPALDELYNKRKRYLSESGNLFTEDDIWNAVIDGSFRTDEILNTLLGLLGEWFG